jgi:hypothetical protein
MSCVAETDLGFSYQLWFFEAARNGTRSRSSG